MTYKSSSAWAWGFYVAVLLIELLVDYLMRKTSDNFYIAGIPEPSWFFLQILAATIGGCFIIYGTRYLKNRPDKTVHVVTNFAAGILFYVLAVYSYVLGLGIDSP